jgi:hypothetical protein
MKIKIFLMLPIFVASISAHGFDLARDTLIFYSGCLISQKEPLKIGDKVSIIHGNSTKNILVAKENFESAAAKKCQSHGLRTWITDTEPGFMDFGFKNLPRDYSLKVRDSVKIKTISENEAKKATAKFSGCSLSEYTNMTGISLQPFPGHSLSVYRFTKILSEEIKINVCYLHVYNGKFLGTESEEVQGASSTSFEYLRKAFTDPFKASQIEGFLLTPKSELKILYVKEGMEGTNFLVASPTDYLQIKGDFEYYHRPH